MVEASLGKVPPLLTIVLVMLPIVLIAGAVLLYAAYPHRGEQVPGAPWLGDAARKAVDRLPLLEEDEAA